MSAELSSLILQFPMLLMCVPICGLLSLGVTRWWRDPNLDRVLLLNGILSIVTVSLLVVNFQHGPAMSRLSPADSFQFLNRVRGAHGVGSGYRFGLDGCSLVPLVMIALLPVLNHLAERWKKRSLLQAVAPRWNLASAGLFLALQFLLMMFVTALDRRVQLVSLLLLSLNLHLLLALTLPRATRRTLNRRMRQLLLSDFLIAGGYLFSVTPLHRYTELNPFDPALYDVSKLLSSLELLRLEEPVAYQHLLRSLSSGLSVMLVGCLIRFGVFPFTRDSRRMWQETAPLHRLMFWATGPVLGTVVLMRELQLFPEIGAYLFARVDWLLIPGLLWLGCCRESSEKPDDDSIDLVFVMTLTILCLGGQNTTALAAGVLLLVVTGQYLVLPRTQPTAADSGVLRRGWRFGTQIMLSVALVLALLGLWQSEGVGYRNLFGTFWTGIAVILWLLGWKKNSSTSRNENCRHWISRSRLPTERIPSGQWPVWEVISTHSQSTCENRFSSLQQSAVVALCLLMIFLPQAIWQTIRWDFQKLEFPAVRSELTSSEVER